MEMIKIYVKITFYDENGLHPAGSITMVREEDFNPFYMKRIPELPPIPANLGDLADVATTGAQDGDVLTFDGVDWIPGVISGVESLDELDDVAISSATDGQVLTYNGEAWVNATPATPSGGGIDASVIADEYEVGTPGPTYNVGDYVKKGTKYYKCNGTTSGTWDSAKWDEITISFNKAQGQVPANGYAISNDDKLWKNKSAYQAWFDPTSPASYAFDECPYTTYEAGTTVTYNAGDFVMYEDELYKCTSTTSGTWDSSKWAKISVEEMVVENGGAQTLDELSDVDVDTATDGQVLTYDAGNTKWIATTPSGGGGSAEQVVYTASMSDADFSSLYQLLSSTGGKTQIGQALSNLQFTKSAPSGTYDADKIDTLFVLVDASNHKLVMRVIEKLNDNFTVVFADGSNRMLVMCLQNSTVNPDSQFNLVNAWPTFPLN